MRKIMSLVLSVSILVSSLFVVSPVMADVSSDLSGIVNQAQGQVLSNDFMPRDSNSWEDSVNLSDPTLMDGLKLTGVVKSDMKAIQSRIGRYNFSKKNSSLYLYVDYARKSDSGVYVSAEAFKKPAMFVDFSSYSENKVFVELGLWNGYNGLVGSNSVKPATMNLLKAYVPNNYTEVYTLVDNYMNDPFANTDSLGKTFVVDGKTVTISTVAIGENRVCKDSKTPTLMLTIGDVGFE